MKYIREGRFGQSKQWKTGAVVSTYPRPLLAVSLDEGGLDVVTAPTPRYIKTSELSAECRKSAADLAPITAIDLCDASSKLLSLDFAVRPDSSRMQALVDISTTLINLKDKLPFRTVVIDPLTEVEAAILGHIASAQNAALADPRKWASMVGQKVKDLVLAFTQLPCHVVFIMHANVDKNETTGVIVETPRLYSKYRDVIGANLSQFFYATKVGGKPKIFTTDQGFVRGLGARWPANLPPVCDPTFQAIYGAELPDQSPSPVAKA
jgi:hypothetical protein